MDFNQSHGVLTGLDPTKANDAVANLGGLEQDLLHGEDRIRFEAREPVDTFIDQIIKEGKVVEPAVENPAGAGLGKGQNPVEKGGILGVGVFNKPQAVDLSEFSEIVGYESGISSSLGAGLYVLIIGAIFGVVGGFMRNPGVQSRE